MSAPSPRPQTLELDVHSKQFFDPAYWRGEALARFRLDVESLKDRVFIGRAALFCDERLHLVMREEASENAPLLVSLLPLPYQPSDRKLWPRQIAGYFETHLTTRTERETEENGSDEFVPMLRGMGTLCGLVRLHLDARTGLGLAFYADGDANILDLREARDEEGAQKENAPFLYLGDVLLEDDELEDPMRTFLSLPCAQFHARVDAMLGDPQSELAASLRFHLMSQEERCQTSFGCTLEALEQTLEMLLLVLVVELREGGELERFAEVGWHPWGHEDVLDVQGPAPAQWHGIDTPKQVKRWRDAVGEKTGCAMHGDLRFDNLEASALAREFTQNFLVRAQRPSAHETIEAMATLREMMS